MTYSVEYHETRAESGPPGWGYRILKDGVVMSVSPPGSPYRTKGDAEMMAEEIVMRLEEDESEADAG